MAGEMNVSVKLSAENLASAPVEAANASLTKFEVTVARFPGGAGGAFIDSQSKIVAASEAAAKAHEQQIKSLEKLHDGFLDTAKEAAAFGAGMLGLQVGQSIFESLKTAIIDFPEAIDRARITLETFTGSATMAETVIGQLKDLSGATPFHFEALAQTAQTLIALGAPAQEVASQVKDIAAAVAAVGGGDSDLQRIATSLSRIQETGTVTALTMRQLMTEQIPGWQILETALGKTQAQVAALMKTGQITSDVFLTAFHEWASTTAGEALAKQTDTLSGSLTVFQNRSQLLLSTALAPLTDHLTRAAQAAARFSQSDDLQQWADAVAVGLIKVNALSDQTPSRTQQVISAVSQLSNPLTSIPTQVNLLSSTWGDALAQVDTQTKMHGDPTISKLGEMGNAVLRLWNNITVVGTKSADLFPGLDSSKATGIDALTKSSDGLTFATGRTREELNLLRQDQASAVTDALSLSVGYDRLAASVEHLTTAQLSAAESASGGVAAYKQLFVETDPGMIALQAKIDAVKAHQDALKDNTTSTGYAMKQMSELAIPGLQAFDALVFGTSQKLAGVQLQIEEKVLARMERRPAVTLYQQEALLQEQVKIEGLQRTTEFGPQIRQVQLANMLASQQNQQSRAGGRAAKPIEQDLAEQLAALEAQKTQYKTILDQEAAWTADNLAKVATASPGMAALITGDMKTQQADFATFLTTQTSAAKAAADDATRQILIDQVMATNALRTLENAMPGAPQQAMLPLPTGILGSSGPTAVNPFRGTGNSHMVTFSATSSGQGAPGQSTGSGVTINSPLVHVGQITTVEQAHAVGTQVGNALAQLVQGASGAQGLAHRQLAGVR